MNKIEKIGIVFGVVTLSGMVYSMVDFNQIKNSENKYKPAEAEAWVGNEGNVVMTTTDKWGGEALIEEDSIYEQQKPNVSNMTESHNVSVEDYYVNKWLILNQKVKQAEIEGNSLEREIKRDAHMRLIRGY